ncbi:hypothetical protein [Cellulomonas rhizosphaerae]|nr:hypothetical protein [Cellulomonas rhizosphaerae]
MPTVTGYDATVPTNIPTSTDGRALPYAVAWPSPGGAAEESAVHDTSGALDWTEQVTVAAGDVIWCLKAVHTVRATLAGRVLVANAGPLVDETPRSVTLQRDTDVSPPRWFVPLFFACLTA